MGEAIERGRGTVERRAAPFWRAAQASDALRSAASRAVRAVRAIGLDIGGVDFITDDITNSYKDIGGAIVEVNAGPGFRMHVAPSEGEPRDVAGKVLDMLYPPGTPIRIPVAAITGTNGVSAELISGPSPATAATEPINRIESAKTRGERARIEVRDLMVGLLRS